MLQLDTGSRSQNERLRKVADLIQAVLGPGKESGILESGRSQALFAAELTFTTTKEGAREIERWRDRGREERKKAREGERQPSWQ